MPNWKNIKLQKYNIPNWYIKDAEKIKYMFLKSHTIGYTITIVNIKS